MNIPQFTAEVVLSANGQSYRSCMAECQDACGTDFTCLRGCRRHCSPGDGSGGGSGGGSGQPPPNCYSCTALCYVWLAVCEADYAVVTGGLGSLVGILTNELGGFGVDPCVYVKDKCVAECPC